ncbi:MAG: hypothetical protein ACRC42_03145 [Mycoplasma sp.]
MKQFERNDLKKMLIIAKETTNAVIRDIVIEDIIIKYTINKSNNLMSKAQSMKYLVDMYIPIAEAIEIWELHDDPEMIAKATEDNKNKILNEQNSIDNTNIIGGE